jgi:hypothetical protein
VARSKGDDFPVPPDGAAEEPKPEGERPPGKRRKPATRRRRGVGTAPGRSKDALLKEVEESLLQVVATAGTVVSIPRPLIGGVILRDGDDGLVKPMVRIAAKNPRMLRALTGASIATDAVPIIHFGVALVVAAMVEARQMPVDGTVASAFKIDELYEEIMRDEEGVTGDDRTGDATPTGNGHVPTPGLLAGPTGAAPA